MVSKLAKPGAAVPPAVRKAYGFPGKDTYCLSVLGAQAQSARPARTNLGESGSVPEGHSPSAQQSAQPHVASKDLKANLDSPAPHLAPDTYSCKYIRFELSSAA